MAGRVGGAAAGGLDVDVGELDVFDGVAGDAGDDGAELAGGVVADDVADEDAAEGADTCLVACSFGAAQAGAEADEDGAGR